MTHGKNLRRSLAAALAALALIAAGCGDSDDETTATSESDSSAPTQEEFIAEADAICTESNARIDEEVEARFGTSTEPPSEEELLAFFEEVTLPELSTQIESIGELTPPEGQEEEVAAIVEAGEQAIADSEEDPNALLVPQGGSTPFDEASRLAQEFGLEVCGGGEEPAGA